ncbi:MAG TPA: hypothetical protein VFV80_03050 [Geminicoccaceae bacterium]|nr:hypothetical protein [Geminicoccaceae bacterium]
MAGIEVREEGDGVWVVTVPGITGKRDLPNDFDERCYDLGLMVVGVDGRKIHVSPRDSLEAPMSAVLKDLRGYLAKVVPGAAS